MNLISLITIGFVMPENIVFIYTFATDIGDICGCEEGGVKTAVDFIIYPLTYLFGIIHPFLIKKKLGNFKSWYKCTDKVNAWKNRRLIPIISCPLCRSFSTFNLLLDLYFKLYLNNKYCGSLPLVMHWNHNFMFKSEVALHLLEIISQRLKIVKICETLG